MKWRKRFLTGALLLIVMSVSGGQSTCTTGPSCQSTGEACQRTSDCCSGSCYLGAGGRRCIK